jgi:hypothetical protein
VALYSLLRGPCGSLLRGATAAGAFLFLAAYVPLCVMLNELAILVGWRLWAALGWGMGEALSAMLVGAWLSDRLRA